LTAASFVPGSRAASQWGHLSHPTHISSLQDSQRAVSKGMVREILLNYALLNVSVNMCVLNIVRTTYAITIWERSA
jgi:hypothetical protein